MMLKEKSHDFVEWREEFVSRERGSRVVQYYLEDSSGESHLAVVGTVRSLRHMFCAIAEFCHEYGADSCLKWRSKREVVDWLSSFISPRQVCPLTYIATTAAILGNNNMPVFYYTRTRS